ncbi:MAG: hypothetical protein IJU70_05060 [Lentisphaeria bacterium]|nr:hypothetical protein [Lentisphaeria bacterium]
MKIDKILLAAAAFSAGAAFAAEICRPEFKDFIPPKRVEQKDGYFSVSGKQFWVQCMRTFAVDPAKKYTISGEFRFRGTPLKSFYVGLVPLTEKGMGIPPVSIHAEPGTETTLAAPASVGDRILKAADGAKWNNRFPYPAVAFDVKDDFADVPNYSAVAMKKGSVKKAGDVWEIELVSPLKKAYPAGTRIRQHRFGGAYIYTTAKFKNFSGEWEKFSGTVTGMTKNTRSDKQFWPRTAKARLIILTSTGADDSVVEFRNLVVEENE